MAESRSLIAFRPCECKGWRGLFRVGPYLFCDRTYRTEEHNGSRATHAERFERTRESARSHADRLNARG